MNGLTEAALAMSETHLDRHYWRVLPCSHSRAREFIERTHYTGGCPNTNAYAHALLPLNSLRDVRGIALWLPPTRVAAESVNRENWRGVLSLSRLCIAPGMPTNAASFLLGRSMRMINREVWPTLLTYADTRLGHTGAIYRATNWTCLGEMKGHDSWLNRETGQMRGRKRGPRNLSVAEMEAAGFERLPNMPKIKFVHQARS